MPILDINMSPWIESVTVCVYIWDPLSYVNTGRGEDYDLGNRTYKILSNFFTDGGQNITVLSFSISP